MKNILFLSMLLSFSLLMTSCGDDDVEEVVEEHTDLEYHAHINEPSTDDKNVGDAIAIDVDFESHSGETVRHINVRIYSRDDSTQVVYNEPENAHVHEESGEYGFADTFMLTEANSVTAHSDWILEASVWGHEDREGEVIETIEFHVHPE